MTKIINLLGVPSSGKSSGASYIFSRLKMLGINAELVTEFAKDKVWEENKEVFKNQAYLFGKQSYKISRCINKVDIIITDSPICLNAFYNQNEVLGELFNQVVINVYNSYDNITYFLDRVKPYNPKGRLQTEEESNDLKQPMLDFIKKYNINIDGYYNGCLEDYDKIILDILKKNEV